MDSICDTITGETAKQHGLFNARFNRFMRLLDEGGQILLADGIPSLSTVAFMKGLHIGYNKRVNVFRDKTIKTPRFKQRFLINAVHKYYSNVATVDLMIKKMEADLESGFI